MATNTETTKEDIKRNEVADLLDSAARWVRLHPQQALWGALGVLFAALLVAAVFVRRAQAKEEAWTRLAEATSSAYSGQADATLTQVKALTDAQPGSTAAGYGRLLAADVLFQQNKFKEAAQAYQAALEQPGNPAAVPMALAGLALAQEGAADCPSAAATAQRFLDQNADHFLAPQTHAVLARCLAAQGKVPEAKAAFQRIEILYPNTYWEGWAKARK